MQTNNETNGQDDLQIDLNEAERAANEKFQKPRHDIKYIAAAARRGPSAVDDVEGYASRQWREANSELIQIVKRQLAFVMMSIPHTDKRLQEAYAQLKKASGYKVSDGGPAVPWTIGDIIWLVVLYIISCLMLLVGWNTVAQALLNSGLPSFTEHPLAAYAFSLIPTGFAVLLKAARHILTNPEFERRYCMAVLIGAFVFGLLWAVLFAQTFRGMTQSTAEIIRNAGNTTNNDGGWFYITCSILADALIAASIWNACDNIRRKHKGARAMRDPDYKPREEAVKQLENRRSREERVKSTLEGKIEAIEPSRKRFIDEAVGLFNDFLKTQPNLQS